MQHGKVAEQLRLIDRDELREMATAPGPCVSIYLPLHTAGNDIRRDPIRLREAIETVETQLAERGLAKADVDEMARPLRDYVDDLPHRDEQGYGLVLFRSKDIFKQYRLDQEVPDAIVVGENFAVAPLLTSILNRKEFYLLALSQKHIRLLHCDEHTSGEVSLPKGMATNLQDFNFTRQPDHRLENRAHGGQKGKSTHPGMIVASGTGSDADQRDHYLYNFYHAIDQGLTKEVLHNQTIPLVLVGVDYELSLYHTVNTYPYTVPDGVHGAPDGLKGGEMHSRALELLRDHVDVETSRAMEQFEKVAGTPKGVTAAGEIAKAAREGRVQHLFLAVDTSGGPAYEEAVVQTILHSGVIHPLPADKVPGGGVMSALMRY